MEHRFSIQYSMNFLQVTSPEWISGTDSGVIDCLHQGPIDGNVINTYCWIMGTFSVRKHYIDRDTEVNDTKYLFFTI